MGYGYSGVRFRYCNPGIPNPGIPAKFSNPVIVGLVIAAYIAVLQQPIPRLKNCQLNSYKPVITRT